MTDNAPERIIQDCGFVMTCDVALYQEWSEPIEYIRADLYTAVCAERDIQKNSSEKMTEFYEHRGRLLEQEYARAEAAEAAIAAALESLDASLFTNAEHQQAKDILRRAIKPET